ncbi:MAG TPA: transporter [Candidatus Udaeobacter sp.]|nr:transporter [Candidatus Udaeobacter sp.]
MSRLYKKPAFRASAAIGRLVFVAASVEAVTTSPASEPLAKGIQDNSFLIEEAYNQEAGVVQHILNVPINFMNGAREITPSFTQEWPVFSQTHQFSYTIPYAFTEDESGMEDMRLNYRVQALTEDRYTPAFAPRLSLVLPTGDPDKGLGVGRVGYETNLPFSKIVSDHWTVHFNAGMSVFPDVRNHDLTNYNVGASAIFAVSRDFNLMLETVAGWNDDVDEGVFSAGPTVNRSTNVVISPGARYAINLPNDAQWVLGLGLPIGITSDSPDWGFFFYCSFEHRFIRIEANR